MDDQEPGHNLHSLKRHACGIRGDLHGRRWRASAHTLRKIVGHLGA